MTVNCVSASVQTRSQGKEAYTRHDLLACGIKVIEKVYVCFFFLNKTQIDSTSWSYTILEQ